MWARLKPPHIIALSFIGTSFVGAFLLFLPLSRVEAISFVDALFTATSAVCVTGLVVKDTGSFFTPVGQSIILLLIQLGGLGIMTFSTAIGILLGKRLTVRDNVVIQSVLDSQKVEGFKNLIKYIVLVTLSIETVGIALLFLRWQKILPTKGLNLLFSSVFHAVSAFCNAGFSLYSNSFQDFRSDVPINLIITTLIIIGGLGFVMLLDITKLKFWRKDRVKFLSKISLQSKLVALTSLILISLAFVFISVFEWNNTLKELSLKEKLLCVYFHSVTPRTAGFSTLPVSKFRPTTLFFNTALMFVGASPGSTGGGIKTVTLAVLIAASISMLKNRNRISVFKKSVPRAIFRKAFIILVFGLMWIFFVTLFVCITERCRAIEPNFLMKNFFEVVSAFGTVGLSTGITGKLTVISKILIILTMWLGRIGPVTLALIVASGENEPEFIYSEENIMVG